MNSSQIIYNEALNLSDIDRAALAHNLISSLNGAALKTMSQKEVERRVALVHSGEAVSRSAENVFRDVRNAL
jgi:hypothetical protein